MTEEFEENESLANLMELFKKLPKKTISAINAPRYVEALASIRQIVDFVKADCQDADIRVEFDELLGTDLCLLITVDEFNVYKVENFCEAIKPANTMHVIPKLDGRIEIGISYGDARMVFPIKDDDKITK